jgi:molybdenum cofactor cytidylyltransferase
LRKFISKYMSNADHVAVVLAAGQSRRLGVPKQLLRYADNNETLVQRSVRLALESGAKDVFLITGAWREQVMFAVRDLAIAECFNREFATGLSSSLRCAEQRLDDWTGTVLILGCDQINLSTRHLHALLAGATRSQSGCAASRYDAAKPDQVGLPVVLSMAIMREAKNLKVDAGFRTLLRHPAATLCALTAPELAVEIDTPSDLHAAIAAGQLRDLDGISPCQAGD